MAFRLGLELHPDRDLSAEVALVLGWAAGHGVEVVAAGRASGLPDGVTGVPESEMASTCDGVVAIGGDGTVLGALRRVAHRPVPVLGVNRGTVGFLPEVEPALLPQALDRLTRGDFMLETRSCLEVTVTGSPGAVAFNDVAIVRVPGQGFGTLRLDVGGATFGAYRCDALVVATAMGSTAYNYAAMGPLISPRAEVLVVTPVASAAGPSRSLVLTPDEPLQIKVQGSRVALEIDGQVAAELDRGAQVGLRLRPGAGQLVRFEAVGFGHRRIVKLSLQDLPLPQDELRRLLGNIYG